MFIGSDPRRNKVYRCKNALNSHVLALGKSGSGKSRILHGLLSQDMKKNRISIIFNSRNTFNPEYLTETAKKIYDEDSVRYSPDIGIPMHLLKCKENIHDEIGKLKLYREVTNILSSSVDMTVAQEDNVYMAVKEFFAFNENEEKSISEITKFLRAQDYSPASRAAAKLRAICDSGIFYAGEMFNPEKRVYEFNLNSLDLHEQIQIQSFLLEYLMLLASQGFFQDRGVTIYIDECQNLSYKENSIMRTMLNESRKLNISLLLAAPSMFNKKGMEILTQCGTMLFFSPISTERKTIASLIDPKDIRTYIYRLSALQVGDCIACGKFNVEGEGETDDPQILKNYNLSFDMV